MILHLSHHARATSSPMQRIPNFQQHAVMIFPPLIIPKTQFLDALRRQKLLAFSVVLVLFRPTVLKTVEFHRQLCDGTIKIQVVNSERMLPAEFESGKTSCPQGAP